MIWNATRPSAVKKPSAALLAVPLTASMLLAGCSGNTKPDASPPGTSSSSGTTTTATPKTKPTRPTSTANPTTDPNIPAAARAHTPAGAAAFVMYFHDQLNAAWGRPQAGLLAPLSVPGCKTCRALEGNAADLVTSHRHMLGDTVRIDTSDPGSLEPNGDQTVIITGAQLETSVVDSSGHKARRITADKIRSVATTRWTSQGWHVSEIKVLK